MVKTKHIGTLEEQMNRKIEYLCDQPSKKTGHVGTMEELIRREYK